MCTIVIAWRLFEGVPIIFGGNRDERYDRPAAAPSPRDSDPRILAPRDERAGGTWIGINDAGVLVGLANRPSELEGERSRGALVTDTLEAETAASAQEAARAAIHATDYAGFTLLIADATDGFVTRWDGQVAARSLEPGLHVIVNNGMNDEVTKSATIRSRALASAMKSDTAFLERLPDILSDHGSSACIHGEEGGTRSSSIIAYREEGHLIYRFADGPPCTNQYRTVWDGRF